MKDKNENRKSQLPHFKIFEFWKNKCIDENGEVFFEGDINMHGVRIVDREL